MTLFNNPDSADTKSEASLLTFPGMTNVILTGEKLTCDELLAMKDEDERTPLHIMAEKGAFDDLAPLLKDGETLTSTDLLAAKDMDGNTVFHLAAQHGHLAQLAVILPEESRPTVAQLTAAKDDRIGTPFGFAAWKGGMAEMVGLLKDGEKLTLKDLQDCKDSEGESPITDAIVGKKIPELLAVLPKADQSKAMQAAIDADDTGRLYDDEGETLTSLEKLEGLSLKTVATYANNAPDHFLSPLHKIRLSKLQEKIRGQASATFAPPPKQR